MHNIPPKHIIVNADSQVRLLEDDGTAYQAADATPSAGGFILEGFLGLISGSALQLLKAATRIIKTAYTAGTAEIAAYTVAVTTTGMVADDVVRLVVDSLDLTPTLFQNREQEKRYQASSTKTTAATIVAHLVATINADPNAPVTAYAGFNNVSPAQDDSAKIVLVAKTVGQPVYLYKSTTALGDFTLTRVANGTTVYHTAEDTSAVTIAAALAINTYEALKNINWAKNVDFDRNLNYQPLPGTNYNSYYFEVNGTVPGNVGNDPHPSEKHNTVLYPVWMYVKDGLTLETAMDLLVTDMNV